MRQLWETGCALELMGYSVDIVLIIFGRCPPRVISPARTHTRRIGPKPWVTTPAERVVAELQGSPLEGDVAEIVVHEADQPDAFIDLLNAELLADEYGGDVDFREPPCGLSSLQRTISASIGAGCRFT